MHSDTLMRRAPIRLSHCTACGLTDPGRVRRDNRTVF